MSSIHTQLPFGYYSTELHCKPKEGIQYKSENLGEILRGDRIVNTNYQIEMAKDSKCKVLCPGASLNQKAIANIKDKIKKEYHVHLIADNMPCATVYRLGAVTRYDQGYLFGFVRGNPNEKSGKYVVNNHLVIRLKYHQESSSDSYYHIVGFDVEPKSIARKNVEVKPGNLCSLVEGEEEMYVDETTKEIMLTYEVIWERSDIRWASRWDNYLKMSDVQVHWFSIINSFIIVFFMTGVLSMIMVRTVRRDIAQYNREIDVEDVIEETGWKLVHADVFRPPPYPEILTALLGTGLQLFAVTCIILLLAMLGMLSPASRGSFVTVATFMFHCMGIVGGYWSIRLYKTLKGVTWKRTAIITATWYPIFVFAIGIFVNFFIVAKKSSGAVPFKTIIILAAMWLLISLPLVYVGAYFGFRKKSYDHPVRTNQIPKQVPETPWFLNIIPCTMFAGIMPFGALFIELFFIFTAIWQNQFYYLFGFLFLVFVIIVIAVSQISIVITYFNLCSEDYRWWWKSFISSTGVAIYMFLYSIFYFINKLQITGFVSSLIYFSYTFLASFTFAVFCGTVGFYSSYVFVKKIYGAVKFD
ncbi:hypothetical protein SNEBB_003294 [Seison nebaliae]|nr:hypothetical protein SNEBB_003294 [Seison nebaliae]